MLTLAIVFLLFAIVAGIFGLIAASPAALIAFFVFLGLFLASIATHYVREGRSRHPFK
ncbi:MAG TPA: hypothetical protein VM183_12615 [Burkholderiales bacterium]|nr:hypothetical protein [Burkholderiales bacterium]